MSSLLDEYNQEANSCFIPLCFDVRIKGSTTMEVKLLYQSKRQTILQRLEAGIKDRMAIKKPFKTYVVDV